MNAHELIHRARGRLRGPVVHRGVALWRRLFRRRIGRLYHYELVFGTGNFATVRWMDVAIWQNVLDLWTVQEVISRIRPALIIETGTFKGGSALFYAQLMDLIGDGEVVTIDILDRREAEHPRITFLHGSSTDPEIVAQARAHAEAAQGPVLVILDGNHDRDHVAQELEHYGPMVTPGSYLMSQDGVIDQFWTFADSRPGPLPANEAFLAAHPEFENDHELEDRFALTQHPKGWMRRVR